MHKDNNVRFIRQIAKKLITKEGHWLKNKQASDRNPVLIRFPSDACLIKTHSKLYIFSKNIYLIPIIVFIYL